VSDAGLLTISLEEAAAHLRMTPRTLLTHLRRTGARCLVQLNSRTIRIDQRGFFQWCRGLGFPSATGTGDRHGR
jgi:hypothetical protein